MDLGVMAKTVGAAEMAAKAVLAGRAFTFFAFAGLICAKCKVNFVNFVRFGKYLAKLHNI